MSVHFPGFRSDMLCGAMFYRISADLQTPKGLIIHCPNAILRNFRYVSMCSLNFLPSFLLIKHRFPLGLGIFFTFFSRSFAATSPRQAASTRFQNPAKLVRFFPRCSLVDGLHVLHLAGFRPSPRSCRRRGWTCGCTQGDAPQMPADYYCKSLR